MSLMLTGSPDHALLADAVRVASAAVQEKGGYLGRTAVQKLVYFLDRAGVPMSYRFDIHHYGPYCHEVWLDLGRLVADGVLRDRSRNPEKYSDYAMLPGDEADEMHSRHAAHVHKWRPVIERVVNSISSWAPEELEIRSTLDFAFRWLEAGGGNGPFKGRTVDRFINIKKDKFPRARVEAAYDAMAEAGLLKP